MPFRPLPPSPLSPPSLAATQPALAAKFHGSPCGNCGGTVRYYRGGGCVACAKARSAAWQAAHREVARERAAKRYQTARKPLPPAARTLAADVRRKASGAPLDALLRSAELRALLLAWGAVPPATGEDEWGGL